MDSALRPRDIQARIRAGETPEAVAELGGTSLERVMVYAGPVLAEREHVARRAQDSSVRRRSGEAARGTRTLGEAVGAQLRSHNTSPGAVQWDAWRREDGRWTLTALFVTAERAGTGSFVFDARGSYVTPEDDHARWLVGEPVPQPRPADAGGDDLAGARVRRLTAVPGEDGSESTLGDDAIELVSDVPPHGGSALDPDPVEAASPEPDDGQLELPTGDGSASGAGEDAQALDGGFGPAEPEASPPAASSPAAAHAESAASQDATPPPPRRPVNKKRGRASVPSWDEIMFGADDQ